MLQLRNTRIHSSRHATVLSSVVIEEEGQALVWVKEDGETKVKPSAGVAGEIFAGVSLSRNIAPGMHPLVQEGSLAGNASAVLSRTPIAGQLLVKIDGVKKTVVSSAPADATEVQLSGANLYAHASMANKPFVAQMLYVPSVLEARSIVGDGPVGGLASSVIGNIGRLCVAEFGTSYFDASEDWSDVTFVKLGANGTFVPGTEADHIPNVVVKNTPNAQSAFLVLSINVA